tara:strand:- start:27 stop:176 length:150 start_codon:yes stop_codon:yes gene_type:complete
MAEAARAPAKGWARAAMAASSAATAARVEAAREQRPLAQKRWEVQLSRP